MEQEIRNILRQLEDISTQNTLYQQNAWKKINSIDKDVKLILRKVKDLESTISTIKRQTK